MAWVTPSGSRTPTVQVQLMSQTPTSIVGSPEDADVERALTFVLENGQRFDPGARLDSLDVLRTQAADPDVRRALCAAARTDQNPGVRMKALETLQGFEKDAAVRQTLLDALQNDDNSGVRVSAINLLVNSLRADGASGPGGSADFSPCCAIACGTIPTITFACKARPRCVNWAPANFRSFEWQGLTVCETGFLFLGCHSEPALAGEESQINLLSTGENRQRDSSLRSE